MDASPRSLRNWMSTQPRDNTMVIDLNLEASGTDDDTCGEMANSNTGVGAAGPGMVPEEDNNETLSASGKQTTNTGATNDEHTMSTGGSDQQDGDEVAADANSTPRPPELNMRFESYKAARDHYLEYSLRKGFSIRIAWSRKNAEKEYQKVFLVCTKAGKTFVPKEDTQNPQSIVKKRKRSIIPKTGCQAHMYIKKIDGWYHVVQASDEHNHQLIKKPSLTKFLRAHRSIPLEEQQFIKMLHTCNIPMCRQMQLMSRFHGKRENVPYTEKDIANLKASFRRKHTVNDMELCLAYFKKMEKKDKDFFYKIKLDEEDSVERMYWIDGPSRRSYPHFADCISFDATYLTNIYKMPCAPFIGINNYGQSVQFGCGFLRNELTASYVWLMETFLEAMNGLAPKCIITDQDFAMRSSIEMVFKQTIHRNCRWHVMQNLTEKMESYMATHPELKKAFNECINSSLNPQEFEENWDAMLEAHGERGNTDLHAIWKHRQCWVPAYFMHAFFPFMQTTSRSEGFNAVLKRYVSPKNSILDFLKQYEDLQDKILNAERKAEADTALTEPDLWCPRNPIEKQMAKTYTRGIFNRFQWELRESMSYFCQYMGGYLYELSIVDAPVPHYGYRNYMVIANTETGTYACNCCKFERDGMLCCHALKVMSHLNVRQIPEHYILKRWTWDAEAALGDLDPDAHHAYAPRKGMLEEGRIMMAMAQLKDDFRKVAKVACMTNDGIRIVQTHMGNMKTDLTLYLKREEKKARETTAEASTMPSMPSYSAPNAPVQRQNTMDVQGPSGSAGNLSTQKKIGNPPRSITKGRPCETANKNPLDIGTKKARQCSGCGSVLHTIRKCLDKLQRMGLQPRNST